MKSIYYISMIAIMATAGIVRADEEHHCPGGHGCKPETKEVCFNLACYYEGEHDEDHEGFKSCRANATFTKKVTVDGGEVVDDSEDSDHDQQGNDPRFEVKCDGQFLYNDHAHRSTSLLGTLIQGLTGPFPRITLPRGELHGDDGSNGNHVSVSSIEVDTGEHKVRKEGKCFIWTGAP